MSFFGLFVFLNNYSRIMYFKYELRTSQLTSGQLLLFFVADNSIILITNAGYALEFLKLRNWEH